MYKLLICLQLFLIEKDKWRPITLAGVHQGSRFTPPHFFSRSLPSVSIFSRSCGDDWASGGAASPPGSLPAATSTQQVSPPRLFPLCCAKRTTPNPNAKLFVSGHICGFLTAKADGNGLLQHPQGESQCDPGGSQEVVPAACEDVASRQEPDWRRRG